MPGSVIISCHEGEVNGVLIGCLCDYGRMQSFQMSSSTKSGRFVRPDDFRRLLLAWYDAHARELPWRRDTDPYRVWVSEIMLQQTRVAAVIEHYHEFLRRFPTIQKLAAARESSVLAAWSGLGYYRRARMLHAAAKVIARERGGEFPKTAAEWQDLSGIGRYTAAAIASISFGEAVAVVDGNVERVLQRVYGTRFSGEEFWEHAAKLLDPQRAGDFNQAMMELGATVCTPKNPSCLTCPVMQSCLTRGERQFGEAATRQTRREIDVALHRRDGSVFLVQRPPDARLMAGMWELPQIESRALSMTPNSRRTSRNPSTLSPIFSVRHSITVTDYRVRVWDGAIPRNGSGRWVPCGRLSSMPITGLTRKVLRKAGVEIPTARKKAARHGASP
jgi:A/G-specific adenine glycosylase